MAARSAYRIFVGNVPWTISKKELKEHFSQFGQVATAHVAVDRETGWTRGYGFVQFSSRSGFIAATNAESHSIEGQRVVVQASIARTVDEEPA